MTKSLCGFKERLKMEKRKVVDAKLALAYITDCNLATICDMACKKSRPKYEFERQIKIAQTAIDWMNCFKIDYSNTRAVEVAKFGSVEKWAQQLIDACPSLPT